MYFTFHISVFRERKREVIESVDAPCGTVRVTCIVGETTACYVVVWHEPHDYITIYANAFSGLKYPSSRGTVASVV